MMVRPERFELPTFWFVAVAPRIVNHLDLGHRLFLKRGCPETFPIAPATPATARAGEVN